MPRKPPIPEEVKDEVLKRLRRHVQKKYIGRYRVADVVAQFRGRYLYIDWVKERWGFRFGKSHPSKLCRLEYTGNINDWGFVIYKYSDECYDVEALFTLRRPEEVLKVCNAYPEDAMPETLYGRALALFQMGRLEPATNALREAIRFLPLVAKELLKRKHRRPPSLFPGTVAWGGPDEAYAYWECQGKFWEDTPGALAWFKEVLKSKPSTAS